MIHSANKLLKPTSQTAHASHWTRGLVSLSAARFGGGLAKRYAFQLYEESM